MKFTRMGFLGLLVVLAGCAVAGQSTSSESVLVVGATGQTGRLLVADLSKAGYRVRAFSRNAERARELLGDDVDIAVGDVKDPASLRAALTGMDYLISAVGAGGAKGPDRPEKVDYEGVKHMAEEAAAANIKQFVLVSSMGVTHEDHRLNKLFGNVLIWKGKGEQALRDSGVPYTIVRPGGLVNEPGGQGRIVVVQGDPLEAGMLARADVSTVCIEALKHPEARGKTFEIFREDGDAISDWEGVFANLSAD